MKKRMLFLSICAFALNLSIPSAAETVITSWNGTGGQVYDTGFVGNMMRSGEKACLFNMELIENDSPGSGSSEKGVSTDTVWGTNQARKVFTLNDPRAHKAFVVIFVDNQGKTPLSMRINGNLSRFDNWDRSDNIEMYRWIEFPAGWLKKGKNTIGFFCPEAQREEDGWKLYIARADEFADGGGDPAHVGETSFKSTDSGETWKESPFGPLGQTRAEYSVRLSLDRYLSAGWIATPVIDLWKGGSADAIIPQREIQALRLMAETELPPGTAVEYFLRRGTEPGPFATSWEAYHPIGDGASLDYRLNGADLNRRYIQLKAELSTTNPLVSPHIRSVSLTAELEQRIPRHDNIQITGVVNDPIAYSSIPWEWESWDRPEFAELRQTENLDEVIAGCRTEFAAQVRLMDYTFRRWYPGGHATEYPGWDALSIFRQIDKTGGGGMCIQYNLALGGLCQVFGWQAKFINCVGHEVIEIWNDDYGKWVFLDAEFFNNYNADRKTGEPLNMLELHNRYLDYYFPDRPIDWMKDKIVWAPFTEGKEPPITRGVWHRDDTMLPERFDGIVSGWANAAFLRTVPRNNWFEKPTPRPLRHGMSWWPWNGYLNWYDERTPPKRQYSWHTDRPRDMWPDLNKVHIDATQGFGNDRLFLRFETYTPGFSHFEVNADGTGWSKTGDRWTWLLQSGKNVVLVRAVTKAGVKGKPSELTVNFVDTPFAE